jgi:hypothetical protein
MEGQPVAEEPEALEEEAAIEEKEEETCEEQAAEIAPVVTDEEKRVSILKRWGVTEEELTALIDGNGSLRGMMLGYIAEPMVKKFFFEREPAKYIGKHDDHNRMKKGDLIVEYKGYRFDIEVKSLQTKTVKQLKDGTFTGKFQCDASDRRKVTFADNSTLETTLLLYKEFHILAVNLFAFTNEWRFVFAKNKDLPHSTYKKYTDYQKQNLIASLISVTWPPTGIFRDEPFSLMDEIIRDGEIELGQPDVKIEKVEKKKRSKKATPEAAEAEPAPTLPLQDSSH